MSASGQIGKAYGFLKTDSTSARIKQAFSNMKAEPEVQVSQRLLFLVGISQRAPLTVVPPTVFGLNDADQGQLQQISVVMGKKGANCLLLASLPDATNRMVADELGHIFNLMYSCTEIMGEEEVPVADIFFRNENGIYVSKLQVQPPR